MAIAFDAVSNSAYTSTTTKSASHVISGGANGYLVVFIYHEGGTTVSSVTYNSVAMSFVTNTAYNVDANKRLDVYELVNPSSGSNSLSFTLSGSAYNGFQAISYTGVDPITPREVTGVSAPSGTPTTNTVSLSISTQNSWIAAHSRYDGGGTLSGSNDTATTRTTSGDGANITVDSNGVVVGGTRTAGISTTIAGATQMAAFSIRPFGAALSTLALLGVG